MFAALNVYIHPGALTCVHNTYQRMYSFHGTFELRWGTANRARWLCGMQKPSVVFIISPYMKSFWGAVPVSSCRGYKRVNNCIFPELYYHWGGRPTGWCTKLSNLGEERCAGPQAPAFPVLQPRTNLASSVGFSCGHCAETSLGGKGHKHSCPGGLFSLLL